MAIVAEVSDMGMSLNAITQSKHISTVIHMYEEDIMGL